MGKQRLQNFIIQTAPRLLSQLDRDPTSLTYGSFDRNHWQYKIRDFSSAILQQSSLTLALLYIHNFPSNSYFKNKKVKAWSEAGLSYLSKIQLSDGSFNEYYPNEHSYPATSFNLYAGTKTYQLLKLNNPNLLKTFLKSADWLTKNQETEALNQVAAVLPGLSRLLQFTGKSWLKRKLKTHTQWLLNQQTTEGWFREYGGLDAGYLSTTLDFLVDYWQQTQDKKTWQAIEKIVKVLAYLVHPDGTVGGQYTSRHTTYLCLGGLAQIAHKLPFAQAILDKVYASPTLFWQILDDRYLSHNLLYSLTAAYLNYPKKVGNLPKLPCEINHHHYFPQAGILTKKQNGYFLTIGAKKGGPIYLWKNNQPYFGHIGWEAKLVSGKLAVTNWLTDKWKIKETIKDINISGYFYLPFIKNPSLGSHIILRLASLILGNRLISLLKRRLIFQTKSTRIKYERRISFKKSSLTIIDTVNSPHLLTKIMPAGNFSKRHISSSNFSQPFDLLVPTRPVFNKKKQIRWVKSIKLS